jgi:acetyltransferase-like isoleucine patch superfamily enzyme
MKSLLRLPGRIWRYITRKARIYIYKGIIALPYFHFIRNTNHQAAQRTLRMWFMQKVMGFNKHVYWPVHFTSKINQHQHIIVGVETLPGYEPGCYIQGMGKIYMGDYTLIAQNVGIISSNHDLYDTNKHDHDSVIRIGHYCWLGMNSIILPNVTLGDFTIVGAGAVVTKSFPEGYCVIAGNPAKIIKHLDKEKCIPYRIDKEYVGYIPKEKFEAYRKKKLWI